MGVFKGVPTVHSGFDSRTARQGLTAYQFSSLKRGGGIRPVIGRNKKE